MKTRNWTWLILPLFALGCAGELERSSEGTQSHALVAGSCAPADCGGPASVGSCWCDDLCTSYGDCCEDKEPVCDGPPADCQPMECGPKPGMPNTLCADGVTVAGPGECIHLDDGSCGWEIVKCPDSAYQVCGGFAGFDCPEGYDCADDPTDDCHPASGGTDCPMYCVPFQPEPEPLPPSCAGYCGTGPVPDSLPACYCDSVCSWYGDCCDDFADHC